MNMTNSCDWANQERLVKKWGKIWEGFTSRKRPRKNFIAYFDESEDEESDMAVQYSYDILEKMTEERFLNNELGMVQYYDNGDDLNMESLQKNGFASPMVFHSTRGLGIKIPPQTFTAKDVKTYIGPSRMIDVMDCSSQETVSMRLDQFCKYYDDHSTGTDSRLLNVISLEFSHTPLDPLVEPPKVVKELDWVNLVWPKDMKDSQTDSTNDIRKMMYPKVQKYCLMSVAGCYTDFHLDFGGTSVWYHVLRGEKVFFLVPPSPTAYCRFEDWQKHGQQEKTFFPDIVEHCVMVRLKEGDTLLLPSGWIHGVYTPKKSLVFGGNFLNSFHISRQLEVANMEKQLKVQGRFCYPYYSQIHWYVIEKYSQCLTELANSREPDIKRSCRSDDYTFPPGKWVESVSLTRFPADKFKMRTLFEKETLPSPYIASCEREGLNNLIQKMKAGLFLSDAPGRVGNPHSLLSLLETQLQLRTLCSSTPNGITVLSIVQAKEEKDAYPCKLEAKKQEVAKHGDFEVIDIIKEFFGEEKGQYMNEEQAAQQPRMNTDPSAALIQSVTKQTGSNSPVSNGKQNKTSQIVTQLDHTQSQQSHDPQHQVDNSKLIEDLMKTTFGDKPVLDGDGMDTVPVDTPTQDTEDHMTSLLELTADQMIQSLLTPMASASDHKQCTSISTPPPVEDHVISGANHMMPNIVTPTTHVTHTSNNHMTSNPATPTIDIPSLPNIPSLTPDNVTQLLDQVNMLSGLVLPVLNNKPVTSDDETLSKIVSSSLDLLSPTPSTNSLHFPFTSVPSTATPSVSSLAISPSTLSLTNQIERGILSSLNPAQSPQSPLLHSITSSSSTGLLSPLVPNTTPSKPSSLLINPISTDKTGFSLTTPTGSLPSPSTVQPLPKNVKKTKPRRPRNNSKSKKGQASRKSRCGKCEGCKRSPCGECKFCLDSVRMGGFGKLKKACIQRRCSNMMDPKTSSTSSDSPNDPFQSNHKPESLLSLKKELVKTTKRQRSTSGSCGSLPGGLATPSLDTDPTIEVLSMGFANSSGNNAMESTPPDDLVLHPDTFGFTGSNSSLNTGSLHTDGVTSSNTQESPLMRINDTFTHEDPLFNASSISAIHAQVFSSPSTSQLSAIPSSAMDIFPFSSHSSISENDFGLHLSEDNV